MSVCFDVPRVEAAHVVITLHATIHDGGITLFSDALLGDFVVDPIGETPHGAIDFAKLDLPAGVVEDGVFEVLVKVAVVQEDIRVVPPPVEMTLNRLDGLDDTVELLISGEDNKGGVCSGTGVVDVHTSGGKNFVVVLTNPSVWGKSQQGLGLKARKNKPDGRRCTGWDENAARGRRMSHEDKDY
jgi:hypothetical protein